VNQEEQRSHEFETHYQPYEQSQETISRRRFLSYTTGLLTGAIALLLGIPLAGVVVGPLLKKKKSPWVRLGELSDIAPGVPAKFTYSFRKADGWFEKTFRGTAYVIKPKSGGDFTVLSNVCTHLGCGVRWDSDQQAFLCPCHNGGFDIEGKVTLGPPPRPLDRFTHKVEEGVIFIQVREG